MKFTKLYSNQEDKFPTILFNDWLNVIFWHISNLSDKDKDSHNLWKTTLLHLLDFMLIKKVNNDFFLKKYSQLTDFIFFLQIQLNTWWYLTIMRWATTKISIKKHTDADLDVRQLEKKQWTHFEIWFDSAKSIVDNEIWLSFLWKFDFRKWLWYCLRSQDDYWDLFRLPKYSRSPDIDWKPYLFLVMGLDSDVLTKRYELIDNLDNEIEYEKKESQKLWNDDSYDKIDTILTIAKSDFEAIKWDLNQFNLLQNDLQINEDVVNNIESEVAKLNNELYNTDRDIKQIEEILSHEMSFNLDTIKKIFDEVHVTMPDILIKKYEDLLDFNKKVIFERKKHFWEKLWKLIDKSKDIKDKLEKLNLDRMQKLSHLRSSDFFDKYKNSQDKLNQKSQQIWVLEERKRTFLELDRVRERISILKSEVENVERNIQQSIRSQNPTLLALKKVFTELTNKILSVKWVLSIANLNTWNIDFKCDVISNNDWVEINTSESEWHSYKKFLAWIFDLSLIVIHHQNSFYKTIFHDGIFEWADDRKKRLFLDAVKDICTTYGIQYIMTIIESDLPEIDHWKKYVFEEADVILHLSDQENGRLFKMTPF
jgi:uncharacterized protein YydD (DUF2326 family)